MIYAKKGDVHSFLTPQEIKDSFYHALDKIGKKKKVLIIPPDFSRRNSYAGELTNLAWQYYQNSVTDILPALGTHRPMTKIEIKKMFGEIPLTLFREHNFREDATTIGEVGAYYLHEISEHRINYSWPVQINKLITEGDYDLILSIGQVVPHEVTGMSNFNKNIFIGTGGVESINKSHFLGAVYGMERIMGRIDTPVRKLLNYAQDHFLKNLPIVFVHTVIGILHEEKPAVHGLFIGNDKKCFRLAALLSAKVNITLIDKPLKKVVVYLDPQEFKSVWIGNKSIYRTRMAIADGGELIILGPGLREFGEDKGIDRLIRKYGYASTPVILNAVANNEDLNSNLGAAAHLIHGSSDARFSITYCPGKLTQEEIESVHFKYSNPAQMHEKYNPGKLKEGFNIMPDGEEIYFISNPALGLWALRERFDILNEPLL